MRHESSCISDVEERHPLGALLDLLDGHLVDLALDADVVDDGAVGVAERRDEELVPEGRAVGFVVEQADRRVDARLDALADDVDGLGVGAGPLEEAAVAADNLLHGVPRELQEALARVHDGVVGERRVRHREVLLRRLERHHESEVGLHELLRRADRRRRGLGAQQQRLLGRARVQDLVRLVGRVVANDAAQRLVLGAQVRHLLEQRLEQKLLANARPLGVLAVALAPLDALLVRQRPTAQSVLAGECAREADDAARVARPTEVGRGGRIGEPPPLLARRRWPARRGARRDAAARVAREARPHAGVHEAADLG
mmetsp:Transcript_24786/g.98408  ORF Transcript_24786/g.98408 Transcript_24786/m.98408 type:complete len:313 (-) Transcript_24786:42-980(-)